MTTGWAALSDLQLWSRAADQQDGEVFGQLFERHADAVYTYCFRRTGDSHTCARLGVPRATHH